MDLIPFGLTPSCPRRVLNASSRDGRDGGEIRGREVYMRFADSTRADHLIGCWLSRMASASICAFSKDQPGIRIAKALEISRHGKKLKIFIIPKEFSSSPEFVACFSFFL